MHIIFVLALRHLFFSVYLVEPEGKDVQKCLKAGNNRSTFVHRLKALGLIVQLAEH